MGVLKFSIPIEAGSSSKNSRQLVHTEGGGIRSLPGKKARAGKPVIQGAALAALSDLIGHETGPQGFFGPDDDVAIKITRHVESGKVDVEVWSCAPKPEGRNGRGQDIDNLASTILDALQGIAFKNDAQVAWLQTERIYD